MKEHTPRKRGDERWAETLAKARALRDPDQRYDPVEPLSYCVPGCSVCGGHGILLYDVPPHHHQYGVWQDCPNKPRQVIAERHGITEQEYERMDWSDIISDGSAERAVAAVTKTMGRGYGWVMMYGPPGKAKTMILQRAVKDALERGWTARYAHMSELLGWLRQSFDAERSQTELNSRLESLTKIKLLAIDELSRYNTTEWAKEQVHLLMDSRYHTAAVRKDTITLMGSNSSPMSFDDYLRDRLMDGRFELVQMVGDSMRPGLGLED